MQSLVDIIPICSNLGCDKKVTRIASGLCITCHNYRRRTGVDRPSYLVKRNLSLRPMCNNTGCDNEATQPASGLCKTCYNYRCRTGADRPYSLVKQGGFLCRNQNCRKPLGHDRSSTKHRCHRCYGYKNRMGFDRPLRLTRFSLEPGYEEYCKNPGCDRPIKSPVMRIRCQGRCNACYIWFKKFITEKPSDQCPTAIRHGWCDCGAVAIKIETVYTMSNVYKKTQCKIPLCERCASEFI